MSCFAFLDGVCVFFVVFMISSVLYTVPCIFGESGKIDVCVVVIMRFFKHTACFNDFQRSFVFLWVVSNVLLILMILVVVNDLGWCGW